MGTYEADDVMTRLMDLKKRLMEDPESREEYERADDDFTLIAADNTTPATQRMVNCRPSLKVSARSGLSFGS